ncbi:MAG: S8 family serine peptidase [Candidatus Kerfeldbacteria bacterium]
MSNKATTKLDTDIRVKLGLSLGMIAAAFVGMAFIGVLSKLVTTEKIIEPIPIVIAEDTPTFTESKLQFAPGEIIVKMKSDAIKSIDDVANIIKQDTSRLFKNKQAKELATTTFSSKKVFKDIDDKNIRGTDLGLDRVYSISIPKEINVVTFLETSSLLSNEDIEYIEPNYLSYITYIPNDQDYLSQWSHQITDAELGWDIERGDEEAVIAVLDTGVDYLHQDLFDNMLGDCTNGCPENTGYDFVDINFADYQAYGYIAVEGEDYDTPDNDPSDVHSHGTHCSGIVGEVADNLNGGVGVCHNCKIMPVRAGFAMTDNSGARLGSLENDDIANAIVYATDAGADVFSMSFGGSWSQLEEDAIAYAYNNGVTLIAAMGNDFSEGAKYPAMDDRVIAVAATTDNDDRAVYSNWGYVTDIAAPGSQIYSTIPGGDFAEYSGTSMATPYVAGLAGLILSQNPEYTSQQVKLALQNGADMIQTDHYIGEGRVNVEGSLSLDYVSNMFSNLLGHGDIMFEEYEIIGSAYADEPISGYFLEYYDGTSWNFFGGGTQSVEDGILGVLDARTLVDGQLYDIRLTVADNTNQYTAVSYGSYTAVHTEPYIRLPITRMPAAVADIDKDYQGLEIAALSQSGGLFIYHEDGTEVPGFPTGVTLGLGSYEALSIGDIDNDDQEEIIIGAWQDNRLFAINHDATEVEGWPVSFPQGYQPSTAVIKNVDEDPENEIIVITLDGIVYIIEGDGTIQLTYEQVNPSYGNRIGEPYVLDVDNDNEIEIVTGIKYYDEIWHSRINILDIEGNIEYTWDVEGEVLTDLAVANIDRQTKEYEIAFTACEFMAFDCNAFIKRLDGTNINQNWPVYHDTWLSGGIVAANIINNTSNDRDNLEIIYTIDDQLFVYDFEGNLVQGWPQQISCDQAIEIVVGDVTNDIHPEIGFGMGSIFYDTQCSAQIFSADGTQALDSPYYLIGGKLYGPTITDVDQDGYIDWIQSTYGMGVYRFELPYSYNSETLQIPTFMSSASRMSEQNYVCLPGAEQDIDCVETRVCSDGTLYGECNTQQKYCDEGSLISRCNLCNRGCTGDYSCQSGECCKKVSGQLICKDELEQQNESLPPAL